MEVSWEINSKSCPEIFIWNSALNVSMLISNIALPCEIWVCLFISYFRRKDFKIISLFTYGQSQTYAYTHTYSVLVRMDVRCHMVLAGRLDFRQIEASTFTNTHTEWVMIWVYSERAEKVPAGIRLFYFYLAIMRHYVFILDGSLWMPYVRFMCEGRGTDAFICRYNLYFDFIIYYLFTQFFSSLGWSSSLIATMRRVRIVVVHAD